MGISQGGNMRSCLVKSSQLFWCFWFIKFTCLPNTKILTSDLASRFRADTKSIFLHAKSTDYYQFLPVSGNMSGRAKRGESTAKGAAPTQNQPVSTNTKSSVSVNKLSKKLLSRPSNELLGAGDGGPAKSEYSVATSES
jgi:hypothetical protein